MTKSAAAHSADQGPAATSPARRALPPLHEWILLAVALIGAMTLGGYLRTGDETYAGITVVAAALAYRLRNPII